MSITIQPLVTDGPVFDGAIAVYGEAFALPPYSDPDRGAEIRARLRDTHRLRPGFKALVALGPEGQPVGMIYGYRGSPGQWWHDTVAARLTPDQRRTWLSDSYELVEVAVSPEWQSQGIGEALIGALLKARPEATCVLSTRSDSRAHLLYRRLGFEVIIEMAFVTHGAPFLVMGKRLHPAP